MGLIPTDSLHVSALSCNLLVFSCNAFFKHQWIPNFFASPKFGEEEKARHCDYIIAFNPIAIHISYRNKLRPKVVR